MSEETKFITYLVLGESTEEKIREDFEKYKEYFTGDKCETRNFHLFKCVDDHYLLTVQLDGIHTDATIVWEFPFTKRTSEYSRAFIDHCVWEGHLWSYDKDPDRVLKFSSIRAHHGNRLGHDVIIAQKYLCDPNKKPVLILSKKDYEPIPSNTKSAAKSKTSTDT